MNRNSVLDTVRSQGFAPLESDIPGDLTIEGYRSQRAARSMRWERARAGVLIAELVGLVTVTVASARR